MAVPAYGPVDPAAATGPHFVCLWHTDLLEESEGFPPLLTGL